MLSITELSAFILIVFGLFLIPGPAVGAKSLSSDLYQSRLASTTPRSNIIFQKIIRTLPKGFSKLF